MNKKKKKFKLPRVQWHIKPVEKVKQSEKIYNRKKINREEN